MVDGKVKDASGSRCRVDTPVGTFDVDCGHSHRAGEQVLLLLKQCASPCPDPGGGSEVRARVEDVLFDRGEFKVTFQGGLVLHMAQPPRVGSEISMTFQAECLGHD